MKEIDPTADRNIGDVVLRIREGLAFGQPIDGIVDGADLRALLDAYEEAVALLGLLSVPGPHIAACRLTGAYPTMPQGHLLLGDGRRSLAVLDGGGSMSIGGIKVTDPAVLEAAAEHLVMLAGRLREAGR